MGMIHEIPHSLYIPNIKENYIVITKKQENCTFIKHSLIAEALSAKAVPKKDYAVRKV